MEIVRRENADVLTLVLSGRLDAYWAEHLDGAVEDAVREGKRHIRADMSGVPYVSSAGIGILVKAHRALSDLDGTFAITEPSEAVRKVLAVVGLLPLLTAPGLPATAARGERETAHARATVTELAGASPFVARLHGDPVLAAAPRVADSALRALGVPRRGVLVGVGAFGADPAECRGRLGELLAAAGSTVALPTDGATVPDYQLPAADFLPEVVLLHGIACEGGFSRAIRFDAHDSARGAPLSDLAALALESAGGDAVAVVAIAETSGLVGAALRRSPAVAVDADPFAHPFVRSLLGHTPEPAFSRSIALVAGVAARRADGRLAAFLRPAREPDGPLVHLHAAAFPHRPVRREAGAPGDAIAALFAGGGPAAVLHLLHDARPIEGAGESGFTRGTLWAGAIATVEEG